MTDKQKALLDLFLETNNIAKVIRRSQNEDGSFDFTTLERPTKPIDFPSHPGEFAIKIHETKPGAPLSPIYVNLRNLPDNVLDAIAEVLAEVKLNEVFHYVTGIPKTALVMAQKFADYSNITFIDVLEKIGTDTNRKIVTKDGAVSGKGKKLLILDDVVSQGKSKLEAVEAAESLGYEVGILVLIDRQQGGMQQLTDEGYPVYAALGLKEVTKYYLDTDQITQDQHDKVQSYLSGSDSKTVRLPGLIDTHVHLREPGWEYKEDFESGTKAAIAGGYTIILDMPNNPEPIVSPESLQNKIKLAEGRIYSDLGFHFGGTADSTVYFDQIRDKVFGLKVYMNHTTGPLLVEADDDLHRIFSAWPKDKVLMVHAEEQTLIEAIDLAKFYKIRLHVCHVSLKMQVEAIWNAKDEKLLVTAETSAHHLFLTQKDVKKLKNYGMMRPPLASAEDQKALWEGITDGTIDIIASDHAPHTREEKENPEKVVNGVPGLETTLPLLLTAVNDGRLTMERLIELTSTNPRKIFDIPEQEDTYVEVDLDQKYEIDPKNLYTKCGWSPFEGMKVKGKIKKVVLRGKTVFEDGKIINGPKGKAISPSV